MNVGDRVETSIKRAGQVRTGRIVEIEGNNVFLVEMEWRGLPSRLRTLRFTRDEIFLCPPRGWWLFPVIVVLVVILYGAHRKGLL